MKSKVYIAEDSGLPSTTINSRYSKGEVVRRYIAVLDEISELYEERIEIQKNKKRAEVLKLNLSRF